MTEPSHWFAVLFAWLWTWVGDRQGGWSGECSCNCTCEVQAQVCPGIFWVAEGLRLVIYGGLGILLGAGFLVNLLTGILGGAARLVHTSWTTPSTTPTNGRSSLAPAVTEGGEGDQRERALRQLQELRGRRGIRN